MAEPFASLPDSLEFFLLCFALLAASLFLAIRQPREHTRATPGAPMTLDQTGEAIDDLIDRWHDGESPRLPLHTWLGMRPEQYAAFVERCEIPEGYQVPSRSTPCRPKSS